MLFHNYDMIFGINGYKAEGYPICEEPVTDMGEEQEGWKVICPLCGEIDLEEHFNEAYWDNLNDDF